MVLVSGQAFKGPEWNFDSIPDEHSMDQNDSLFGNGPPSQDLASFSMLRELQDDDDDDADMDQNGAQFGDGVLSQSLGTLSMLQDDHDDDMDMGVNLDDMTIPSFDEFGIPINREQEFDQYGLPIGYDHEDEALTTPKHGYGSSFGTPNGSYRASTNSSSFSLPSPEEWRRTQAMLKPYEFRPGARMADIPMTWVDQDESGNYDPAQERRKAPLPRKKKQTLVYKKLISNNSEDGGDSELQIRKTKFPTWQQGQRTGASLVVSFKFTSARAHDILQEGSRSDKWPDDDTPICDDEDLPKDDDNIDIHRASYRLRKRESNREPVLDPLGLEEDLFGHPDARGCVRCRKTGEDCTLKHHGFSWPCTHCFETDHSCEMIIPPKYKDICVRCDDIGIGCSFTTYDYDEGVMPPKQCDECLDAEISVCRAGPDRTRQYPRIFINEHGRSDDHPCFRVVASPRKYVACTVCRQEKRHCSLKKKTEKGPCNRCKKENIHCTFLDLKAPKAPKLLKPSEKALKARKNSLGEDVLTGAGTESYVVNHESSGTEDFARKPDRKSQPKGKSKAKARPELPSRSVPLIAPTKFVNWAKEYRDTEDFDDLEDEEDVAETATPIQRMTDAEGHSGLTCEIITSYTHPIAFEINPYADDHADVDRSCTWCSENVHGILGLGEKEVWCIAWDSGLGYTELLNGHKSDGCPDSTMCFQCTTSRYQIVMCDDHTLQQLPNMDMEVEDIDTVAEELLQAEPFSKEAKDIQAKFCSLCVNDLAEYECATVQESLILEEHGGKEIAGCGLRLCERCAVIMKTECGDSLDKTIELLEGLAAEDQENGVDIPRFMSRADVGFLKMDGLLNKNMEAYEVEEVDEDDQVRETNGETNEDSGNVAAWSHGALVSTAMAVGSLVLS